MEQSWEKVSARLQPATAGHARMVLSKTVPFFCTTLYCWSTKLGLFSWSPAPSAWTSYTEASLPLKPIYPKKWRVRRTTRGTFFALPFTTLGDERAFLFPLGLLGGVRETDVRSLSLYHIERFRDITMKLFFCDGWIRKNTKCQVLQKQSQSHKTFQYDIS